MNKHNRKTLQVSNTGKQTPQQCTHHRKEHTDDINSKQSLKIDFNPGFSAKLTKATINGHAIDVEVLKSDYNNVLDLTLLQEGSEVAAWLLPDDPLQNLPYLQRLRSS